MTDAFVLGGVRTPVGRYGGSLSDEALGVLRDLPRQGVALVLENPNAA